MLRTIRNWRRRRVLASRSIPDSLWRRAVDVPILRRLTAVDLERLRSLSLLFLAEKHVEAAAGFELDDAQRVRLAALACLPVLELGLDCYAGFASVIVHPAEFVIRDRSEIDEDGIVHTWNDVLSGEAWEAGPIVLGWQEIEASGRGDGFNVVAHEFAHKLDLLDGAINGLPPLHRGMRVVDWTRTFQREFDALVATLERGEEPWLDPYAAEDPGEFFAVCAELFFDVPDELRAEHPSLYALLSQYFRQDPAARVGSA